MCGRTGHVQIPSSVKNSVKSALITITPKMASTTAVVVRALTAAASPRAARPCLQAMSPMISPRKGVLIIPLRKCAPVMVGGGRARRRVASCRDGDRGEEPAAERQHVANPGQQRHGGHERGDSAGTTSQLTGLKPIDRSASISSDTCIVATPKPTRPSGPPRRWR